MLNFSGMYSEYNKENKVFKMEITEVKQVGGGFSWITTQLV